MIINMTETATRLAAKWGFIPEIEIEGGYCSNVYADETQVLKCPWQGEEQTSGYRAALALSGWWGPEVFESDEESGSLLMARVKPGTTLAEPGTSEAEARQVCVNLIQSLGGRIEPEGFPGLADYFAAKHPLQDELLATTKETRFLHGDLHHFNILWSEADQKWIPIDPKGVAGDPAFEPIAFLRNPRPLLHSVDELETLTRDRLAYFSAALNLDPWRIAAWGWVDRADSDEEGEDPLKQVYERILPTLR